MVVLLVNVVVILMIMLVDGLLNAGEIMSEKNELSILKKVQVTIYCKIYTEQYPNFHGKYTGDDIYEHLMSDANCCVDEGMNVTPGDKNIWYLCTNEKHGYLFIQTDTFPYEWSWGMGGSSYKIVKEFVERLFTEGMFTTHQYSNLHREIEIAKTLGDMYQIPEYLKTIKEGRRWLPRITKTKTEMKNMHKNIKEDLEKKGFKFE